MTAKKDPIQSEEVAQTTDGFVQTDTGEDLGKYLYFEGRPREYRFNAQNGQFNLYGEQILTDKSGKTLNRFSFQPISVRLFEDNLFARKGRENWVEVFFVDADSCVSAIMFNGTTANEFDKLMEPLFYQRKSLDEVVVTISPEKVSLKDDPSVSWFIGRFTTEDADPVLVAEMRQYRKVNRIFRADTLTSSAVHKMTYGYSLIPEIHDVEYVKVEAKNLDFDDSPETK